MIRQVEAGELSLDDLRESAVSWAAHASHGDTWRLREAIFSEVVRLSKDEKDEEN